MGGELASPWSTEVACGGDEFLGVCFGVPAEPKDIGLEPISSPSSGSEGVLALPPTVLTLAFGIVVLGPRLMIGLITLVPPLVLRSTPEPAVEVGVGGVWSSATSKA